VDIIDDSARMLRSRGQRAVSRDEFAALFTELTWNYLASEVVVHYS